MLVSLKAPQDKSTKGRLSWLRKQFEYCSKKNEKTYESIENKLFIDVRVKSSRNPVRMSILKFDDLYEEVKDKEILEFRVLYINDFGRNFASPKNFVKQIEKMLIDFYSGIVQYLWKWEPSAPKMAQPAKEAYSEPSVEALPTQEPTEAVRNDNIILSSEEEIPSGSSIEVNAGNEQSNEN
jgi:hypothetical protein